MTRILAGPLVLLALGPALRALDEPRKPPTAAEQVRALEREFREQQEAFQKAFREAKTQEEKQNVFQEKYPQPAELAPRFLDLAEKHPKDPAAVDALVWVVRNAFNNSKNSPYGKALQILRKDHIKSEKLAQVVADQSLRFAVSEGTSEFLREALEKNPHRNVQGLAAMALALNLQQRAKLARQVKDEPVVAKRYEQVFGKDAVQKLGKQDPDKLNGESEKLLQRVVDKYADVKMPSGVALVKEAAAHLQAIREPIAADKPAPEIEEEDIDGKKFKLSDHKGKVVLLDFWGNW
jgi:hypothetical protein